MPPGRGVAPRHRVIVEVTDRAPSIGHRVGPDAQRCLERHGIDARPVRSAVRRAEARDLHMVTKGATTSAVDMEARGEILGEAGPGADLLDAVDRSRARWGTLVHTALVALPFVLGVLVPVLLLALLYRLS